MEMSELFHFSPYHMSLVPWAIVLLSFNLIPLHPPPRFWVGGKVKVYPNNFGYLDFSRAQNKSK